MLIAQISDLHIPVQGEKTYGIADMAGNLSICVEHLNQLDPRPEIVLITGDITSKALTEEFAYAAQIISNLNMPFYIIPGNHDDRKKLQNAFKGSSCPSETDDFIQYVIDGHELRIVMVDSTIHGESGGEICHQRAAWLDKKLAKDINKPTLICMHHPPVKCGVIETDINGFIGDDRLGNVVEKYGNIEAILCGHIHRPAFTRWRGTVVSTAPSMGMQLVLDLNLKTEAFVLEAPAYQLHYWTPDHNLVTHTNYLHNCDGPYLFELYDS
ncbi:MAG: phosphodiesterase [Cocleimonas sp.]